MVPDDPFDVPPVFRVAVIGQGDRESHVVHQGTGFAGDHVTFAADHLRQEPEPGGFGTDVTVKRVYPAVEDRVADGEGVVGRADQGPQVPVHVATVPKRVVRGEVRPVDEDSLDDQLGKFQSGPIIHRSRAGHQALDHKTFERPVPRVAWRLCLLEQRVDHLEDGFSKRFVVFVRIGGNQGVQRQGLVSPSGHVVRVIRLRSKEQTRVGIEIREHFLAPYPFGAHRFAGHPPGHDRSLKLAAHHVAEVRPIVGCLSRGSPEDVEIGHAALIHHSGKIIETPLDVSLQRQRAGTTVACILTAADLTGNNCRSRGGDGSAHELPASESAHLSFSFHEDCRQSP